MQNEFDLTKKEDFEKFNNLIKDLKDNTYLSTIFGHLFDINMNEFYDSVEECAKAIYDNAHKDDKKIDRPSDHIDNVDVKLQLHHLVDEYCNEYIRPYVKDNKEGKDIVNDAYTGLYEFAAWIYNKPHK